MNNSNKMYAISFVYSDGDGYRTEPRFVTADKNVAADFVGYRNQEREQMFRFYMALNKERNPEPDNDIFTFRPNSPEWEKAMEYGHGSFEFTEVEVLGVGN